MELKPRIFCDLDGVLADFDEGIRLICDGKSPHELKKSELWRSVARARGFFANLPWMEDGQILWNYIEKHDPVILTGLPVGKWAEPQKREWCKTQIGENTQVITCLSKEKHLYGNPGDILIDDRISLQVNWEAVGGIFVHHTSAESTIVKLRRLGIS